jgi:hypothetical protein
LLFTNADLSSLARKKDRYTNPYHVFVLLPYLSEEFGKLRHERRQMNENAKMDLRTFFNRKQLDAR